MFESNVVLFYVYAEDIRHFRIVLILWNIVVYQCHLFLHFLINFYIYIERQYV
jgi:hypothetical protein